MKQSSTDSEHPKGNTQPVRAAQGSSHPQEVSNHKSSRSAAGELRDRRFVEEVLEGTRYTWEDYINHKKLLAYLAHESTDDDFDHQKALENANFFEGVRDL